MDNEPKYDRALLIANLSPFNGSVQGLQITPVMYRNDPGNPHFIYAVLHVEKGKDFADAEEKVLRHVEAHPHLRRWWELGKIHSEQVWARVRARAEAEPPWPAVRNGDPVIVNLDGGEVWGTWFADHPNLDKTRWDGDPNIQNAVDRGHAAGNSEAIRAMFGIVREVAQGEESPEVLAAMQKLLNQMECHARMMHW